VRRAYKLALKDDQKERRQPSTIQGPFGGQRFLLRSGFFLGDYHMRAYPHSATESRGN
jgi:hypothetical protein